MKTQRTRDKIGRGICIAFWCVWQFILAVLALGAIQEQAELRERVLPLYHSVICSAVICIMLQSMPVVTLSPDGVCVRKLFRKRFYPWTQFKQAGVLYRIGRGFLHDIGMEDRYNEIVLLKSNGSPLEPNNVTIFLMKNIGKTIHVPYSPEAKSYIIQHYGPLDFDYTDGTKGIAV